ncbi:MAG: alanyl-tRNA editing protein [Anaerolineae bacterium]|nr:alanyl-tRNA editing protein [Anaerolineae bacterium]
MTLKQFWIDPFQTTLDTHVTGVDGDTIQVAETIFYAFAGGQESDRGTIGGYDVREARKDGLAIYYTLDGGHDLAQGDAVTMTIDWPRRYRLMRLHFAAEIILELTYQHLPGIEKIGAHIAEDKSRIDFVWPSNIAAEFPYLTEHAHALIGADRPIVSAFSDAAAERRTWEIEGFARVACGGTHLRSTGEVGRLTLKRKNVGKGKERIEIYLDE